ncbi:MAG: hypothetical protein CEN89_554 [Candidatus Berkelbacteria bacterium Licking1014_7]|uniref:Uncharacterized protein n=1 Tax=Candidatus Berkelbacteria bacterium Licking1014_7 TaxID=2017147 RepID=A0A554LIE0_9BACT|nr:MAG: hypothetical protein CEN89_554 [Candidatus Berkelbacteria bacterium Licking1014_7]
MKKFLNFNTLFGIFLIFGAALARLLPHPANFTPIAAIALFGGRQFSKKISLIIPILALFASDAIIGFYSIKIMLAVYLSFTTTVLLGWQLRKNFSISKMIGLGIISSIVFFLITNAAVWAFSGMYSVNFSGLVLSYWYGLPFFRNELMGTIFYATIIFVCQEIINLITLRTRDSNQSQV